MARASHADVLTAILVLAASALGGEAPAVDFRWSPPEWQSAICFPDDPEKSLVDKTGELLYHYGQGGREFGTRVGVEVARDAVWEKQELLSPRVPIVRTWRSAAGLEILEEAFAVPGPPRADIILVHVRNLGTEARQVPARLIVDTALEFRFLPEEGRVVIGDRETIACSLQMAALAEETKTRRAIRLEDLSAPAGETARFFVLVRKGLSIPSEVATLEHALSSRERAIAYWAEAPLPQGRVQVPDPGIQALVDSSIRNIWQAREIREGLPVFQVGPTCYRGLWIVDGAFLLEAATLLGAGKEARNGIAYTLSLQKPSGAFEVLSPHYTKENGIVLWTCVRHARLTRDKAWLESVWPKLEAAAGYIRELRKRSLENDTALDDGLVPPGEIDGGLSGAAMGFRHPEYTNVYWNLAGLKALIDGARWLGKLDRAAAWQAEYEDFLGAFRKAAARDLRTDTHGNSYLPILMANAGNELPQRAQWAFCHAVYPGQIFARGDPLVAGNLAMLEATEREGMVYGTGWDANGIWTYFASFYAHAWLWQGNGRKAADVLYAFANHASPVLNWREEQSLKGEPFRKVGDMPHNWASAEFIRLVVHLLQIDRGDELHLFQGLPAAWIRPGSTVALRGIATPFGSLETELTVAEDGASARLRVEPLEDPSCRAIVVHLAGWARSEDVAIELDPRQRHERAIPLRSR